jgi:hypothetical protein
MTTTPVPVETPTPDTEGRASDVQVVAAEPRLFWQTPGAVIAAGVAGLAAVRHVLERIAPDRCLVFVVVDQDDDKTLDAIYEVEATLYSKFRNMPFDVRVMRPGSGWDPTHLVASAVVHYGRP